MSEFQPSHILRLLHVVRYRLPMDELSSLGLAYSQIAELLSLGLRDHLIEDSGEEGLVLTPEGQNALDKLIREVYPRNPNEWILPADQHRIPRIGRFDIYLPKRKKGGK